MDLQVDGVMQVNKVLRPSHTGDFYNVVAFFATSDAIFEHCTYAATSCTFSEI